MKKGGTNSSIACRSTSSKASTAITTATETTATEAA
jgi:hypothetical protein